MKGLTRVLKICTDAAWSRQTNSVGSPFPRSPSERIDPMLMSDNGLVFVSDVCPLFEVRKAFGESSWIRLDVN
jgi:hypothetical protein